MEIKSKIFVENKKKKGVLRGILLVVCLIFLLLLLFKLFMGDFKASEITTLFIPLVLIFVFLNGGKQTPIYADVNGKINFDDTEMNITYDCVDGGSSIGEFTQVTDLSYEDIESIEYGTELKCYRILAPCKTSRFLKKFNKEKIIQDKDSVNEILIYVLDENEDVLFRKELQTKAKRIIKDLSID